MAEKKYEDVPIKFIGYKVISIRYGENSDSENTDSQFNVSFGLADDLKNASVRIKIGFANTDKETSGTITVEGQYSLSDGLNEEEAKMFAAQNGSAMLYPYVRTIVSMLTALDDSKVNVLPSLNFVDMFNDANLNDKKN